MQDDFSASYSSLSRFIMQSISIVPAPQGGQRYGRRVGGEQVKPALDSVATQKTVCAPPLSNKRLLLVLSHITTIHPENILKLC